MVQLTIKVTKEILERSKMCYPSAEHKVGEHCAIALAARDIFPMAYVFCTHINPFPETIGNGVAPHILLPPKAQLFIYEFDGASPEERVLMPELEFTVDIPDAIIDRINIDEIRPSLVNHPTLRLIEQQATLPEQTATEMYEEQFDGVMQ